MGRSPCCSEEGLNRGAWTAHEDQILTEYIKTHGQGRWREVPKRAGLKRCGKSCRLRWLNYLRPDIKRGNITTDEEELIIKLHKLLGNRWSLIAGRLPGRTDNEIKNYWNTNLGKRAEGSSTPSPIHKNSAQSRRKKDMAEPSYGRVTSQPVQVVRTKAHRCTKVFIAPQATKSESEVSESDVNNSQGTQMMETNSYNEMHPYNIYEDDYKPSFVMDVGMGDFCMSDTISSGFSYLDETKNTITGKDLHLSSDRNIFINHGMLLEDWRQGDFVQHNDRRFSSDLHPLVPFLDTEDGWLGDQ